MRKITKASTATIALAASLTMLVAGCGTGGSAGNSSSSNSSNSAGSGGSGSSNNSAQTAQKPVDGGTLTMAQGTNFNDQFIPAMDASLYTANISSQAFDPLLTIDKDLNFVPDLATKWTFSSDKKTVTITLADAKWSDGQPITSDDILIYAKLPRFETVQHNAPGPAWLPRRLTCRRRQDVGRYGQLLRRYGRI